VEGVVSSTNGIGFTRPRPARRSVVPSAVLAVLIFIAAETMFFAGLTSAFLIGKAAAGPLLWPPLDHPRLPVATTAVNTLILLASGAALAAGQRAFGRRGAAGARRPVTIALALGAAFVVFQGTEWMRLIGYGLTMTSSTFGSFFYMLVGAHALHAVGALIGLGWLARRLGRGGGTDETLTAVSLFWYFVVGLWPVLYALVYLW
jgi:cytochrome c oxidase subunit III